MADLVASKRFYEGLGFHLARETPDRARFGGEEGSFSVLAGTPTEHLEMALTATREHAELVDPDGNRVELVPG